MAYLIAGETVTAAWRSAAEYLHAHGRETFDLVVEIADPDVAHADRAIVATLNTLLHRKGFGSVETVANTIFPDQLARTARDRADLYARYQALYPRLRHFSQKGTYFGRLIAYPLQGDPARENQLETVIGDLARQLARRGPLGSIYEAQIFAPGKDRIPMGFPCMSSLSFQLDGPQLRLTATYRNQYYIRRALGNFIGLAQLQRFVADAVGLRQGPLTIHAFHAAIDPEIGVRETDALIQAIQVSVQGRTMDGCVA